MRGHASNRAKVPLSLIALGMAASAVPDVDVVAFKFGIAYEDALGHRGASHALLTSALLALLLTPLARRFEMPPVRMFLFIFVSAASHGLLDMLTDGGLGAAVLWPFSETRYFAPVRPIEVSPIGSGFFSKRGLEVLTSELVWIWLPLLLIAISFTQWRRRSLALAGNF